MTKSGIEWTDRSDWNPMRGCTRVSEGCRNCYAERIAGRFSAPGQPFHGFATQTPNGGRWTGRVEMIPDRLDLPLRWRKPARIFVNSAFDLFHEGVPTDWIDMVFAVMAAAPGHTFQVLTKRAQRMRQYLANLDHLRERIIKAAALHLPIPWGVERRMGDFPLPLPNVWLGISAEDQPRLEERWPYLATTPAAVRWISAEPLLGGLDLANIRPDATMKVDALAGYAEHLLGMRETVARVDWIVAGGESGPGARPMNPAWARGLRDQCAAAGVAFNFKQHGAWVEHEQPTHWLGENGALREVGQGVWASDIGVRLVGKAAAGRLLDGVEHNGMPATTKERS